MSIVTPYELKKKLAEVQLESRIGIRGISSSGAKLEQDTADPLYLEEKRINRVQGDEMIAVDGTRGKLFLPLPGLKWRCLGVTAPGGLIALEKELTGLFLSDGEVAYCLGVWGDTDEFEVLLQIGSNEIRINDLFVNLNANLLVKNGLEEKIE